jgi:4-hydroxy-3-methylbut-2-enyl diphosphate reductase
MSEKRVVVAAPRGYCAGVDRAVVTVEKALDVYGPPVYVRKQIVHNRHVVEDLEARGAVERGLKTIDATCPLVTKVHNEARRFAGQGIQILLIGHAGHEEVEGTTGEAPDHITLVQHPDDVDNVELADPGRVAWLSQTTLSVDETWQTVDRLRQKFPALQDPPSDDICYATQNRQSAVKQIAASADLVIVVGSRNSSNSVRLVEVALEAGAKASYRVDNAGEIDPAWLDGVSSVGVTSGASVPDALVQGVLDYLRQRGFPDAVEERLTEENLVFALPPELRKDLRRQTVGD